MLYAHRTAVEGEIMKKKIILIALICNVLFLIYAKNDELFFNEKMKTVYDFQEIDEIRDQMNTNRNYAYPRVISVNEKFSESYNQDKSDSIYIALYVMENLNEEYVSQDLFSEIVEALSTYPKGSFNNFYRKIYIANNLQVSHIICFSKNMDQIIVDIFDEKEKKSIKIKINNLVDDIQVKFEIEATSYSKKTIDFPKEFIEAAWYGMWDYQWKNSETKFILNDNLKKNYLFILSNLNKITWNDFCNNYNSILFIESLFESMYYRPNYLERMVFVELIQRCLIAGM